MADLDAKTDEPATLWQRYRRLPRNVFAIGLVSLLNDASSELIYPFLPLFLSLTLGVSPAVVGLVEGAAESLSSLLKLWAGYISDRVGKRKLLVVLGYGLANVARPFIGYAGSWAQVLAIRLVDRFGKGLRGAPRDAMIADSSMPSQRGLAFGFHRAMDHTGAVIGPLLGYALVWLLAANRDALTAADYKLIFLIAAVPALASVFVALFMVRESEAPHPVNAPRKEPPRLSLAGFDGNFKYFLVLIALFTLSNSSDAFLILRANQAGVPMAQVPLLWAALHLVKVVSSLLGGDLSDRLGRKTLILSGWLLYALVYLGFAFVGSASGAWALFLVYGIYFGLCEGAEKALVADLVTPAQRGTAFGLYNLAFGVTVLPASLLTGAIWRWQGPRAAFITCACLGTLAALLLTGVKTKAVSYP
jgi:MFS family permease